MVLSIKVKPNSHKNRVLFENGVLVVRIAARAHDGKANEALIRFLAECLGIPKSSVTIKSGFTSPFKRVEIPDACIPVIERLKGPDRPTQVVD